MFQGAAATLLPAGCWASGLALAAAHNAVASLHPPPPCLQLADAGFAAAEAAPPPEQSTEDISCAISWARLTEGPQQPGPAGGNGSMVSDDDMPDG